MLCLCIRPGIGDINVNSFINDEEALVKTTFLIVDGQSIPSKLRYINLKFLVLFPDPSRLDIIIYMLQYNSLHCHIGNG